MPKKQKTAAWNEHDFSQHALFCPSCENKHVSYIVLKIFIYSPIEIDK